MQGPEGDTADPNTCDPSEAPCADHDEIAPLLPGSLQEGVGGVEADQRDRVELDIGCGQVDGVVVADAMFEIPTPILGKVAGTPLEQWLLHRRRHHPHVGENGGQLSDPRDSSARAVRTVDGNEHVADRGADIVADDGDRAIDMMSEPLGHAADAEQSWPLRSADPTDDDQVGVFALCHGEKDFPRVSVLDDRPDRHIVQARCLAPRGQLLFLSGDEGLEPARPQLGIDRLEPGHDNDFHTVA